MDVNPQNRHNHYSVNSVHTYIMNPLTLEPVNPTQKPVVLGRMLIRQHAKTGTHVLVLCSGTGTDVIAANMEGHDVVGIESDQVQFKLTTRRLMRYKMAQEVHNNVDAVEPTASEEKNTYNPISLAQENKRYRADLIQAGINLADCKTLLGKLEFTGGLGPESFEHDDIHSQDFQERYAALLQMHQVDTGAHHDAKLKASKKKGKEQSDKSVDSDNAPYFAESEEKLKCLTCDTEGDSETGQWVNCGWCELPTHLECCQLDVKGVYKCSLECLTPDGIKKALESRLISSGSRASSSSAPSVPKPVAMSSNEQLDAPSGVQSGANLAGNVPENANSGASSASSVSSSVAAPETAAPEVEKEGTTAD
jgi:hypothetical protein